MTDLRRQRPQPLDPSVKEVALSLIKESEKLRLRQPPYPRIDELAAHIKAHGQTTPLFVRPLTGGFQELISGYRRLTALKQLGFDRALVRVFQLDDQGAYELALSENQDRDALTSLERAYACVRLQEAELTVEQIAVKMGWKGATHVHRHLRVAKHAPACLRRLLQERKLTMAIASKFLDHQKALPGNHDDVLKHAAETGMSTADFGRYLKRLIDGPRARPDAEPIHVTKDGFVLAKLRFRSTAVDQLDAQIDVLRDALKRARALRKKAEKIAEVEAEATP